MMDLDFEILMSIDDMFYSCNLLFAANFFQNIELSY